MINISDISFQPKPTVTAEIATTTVQDTDALNTGVTGLQGLFKRLLGDSQGTGVMTTAPEEIIEPDLSDQKLIQLEEIDPELVMAEIEELSLVGEMTDLKNLQLGVAKMTPELDDKVMIESLDNTVTTIEPDEPPIELNLLARVSEVANDQPHSTKYIDQMAIESSTRPVSLSELRGVRTGSMRLPHSENLELVSPANGSNKNVNIVDKAIDIDMLSIKQTITTPVDNDEPLLVDKFDVDKTQILQKVKPNTGEIKAEQILGSLTDANLGMDPKAAKSLGHTPISIQSMNGNLELSNIASVQQKSEALLPVSTLALRQPGLDQSLATNISFMINEDIQSANINVKPAELGPVSVQLAVRADHLSITIAASQVQTRESLESTVPRLREQFSSMGFTSVDVNVGDHQSHRQSSERPLADEENPSSNGYAGGDVKGRAEEIEFPLRPRVTHNGMLDTFA